MTRRRRRRRKKNAAAVYRYIYGVYIVSYWKRECDEAEVYKTDSGAEIKKKGIIRWLIQVVRVSNAVVVDER